jgi:hypothetical protein
MKASTYRANSRMNSCAHKLTLATMLDFFRKEQQAPYNNGTS